MPDNKTSQPEHPAFFDRQYEFAASIRHPELNPAPVDVEPRRMAAYQRLFYNNIEDFLSRNFPVIRSLYTDDDWHAMVRDFMHRHDCQSPYYLDLSKEFQQYLATERQAQPCDPVFLLELAHYEWIEIDVATSKAGHIQKDVNPNGDLLTEHPVFSPLAQALQYQYPVHRISPSFQPSEPAEELVYLVVYRDRDDEVHFLEINAVTSRLMQIILSEASISGTEALNRIAIEMQHPDPESILTFGSQILDNLRARGILLGTSTTA